MLDKWPVYLAFTVNEAGCDDVLSLSLSLWACVPCHEVRLFWPHRSVRSRGAIVRSLPKGGSSHGVLMAFTAGSPPAPSLSLSSSFIQHQKDTPSTWPRSRFLTSPSTPRKKSEPLWLLTKLLAATFPSIYVLCKSCGRSERPAARAFPGNLRK